MDDLSTFDRVWPGGYYEGDPLDPLAWSSYRRLGYISVLHAVYQVCIRPYITPQTIALEIGPGRGAWTKTMLGAKEVWCLDAKSREANGIDAYLGHPTHLVCHQVRDFSCRELPDEHFDYLFSFGTFCHLSPDGIRAYLHNLRPKLRSGAHAFVMIADYDRANRVREEAWRYDAPSRIRLGYWSWLWQAAGRRFGLALPPLPLRRRRAPYPFKDTGEDLTPRPGRWYHLGLPAMLRLLEAFGYEVVHPDVGLVPRDPLVHFRVP